MPGARAAFPAKAAQWSRAAWGLAFLFASLPVASRIVLGNWGFPGAGELAGICFLLGLYLYIRSRRMGRVPDAAAVLQKAIGLAAGGNTEQAITLLTRTIRLNPRFWQARQHRGALYLRTNAVDQAIEDFSAAIRLAPEEAHLYTLRGQARAALGDEAAAQADFEAAAALAGERNPSANR